MASIQSLLKSGSANLTNSESADLDAEVLLAHVLRQDRSYLIIHPEAELTPGQQSEFEALLCRRAKGEPVSYVTGVKEFWSLPLFVNKDVLIPRPDTETIVERALARIPDATSRIADMGTGSGAIALAIASERPECWVTGVDNAKAALSVARKNARLLGINNISFELSDWFEVFEDSVFEVIVSNPPYIAKNDLHLDGDIRFEPHDALVAEDNGLRDLQMLVNESANILVDGGWLILEHGFDQGNAVRKMFAHDGWCAITTSTDLAGNERITEACWRG